MKCPHCDSNNPVHFTDCAHCGRSLTAPAAAEDAADAKKEARFNKVVSWALFIGIVGLIVSNWDSIIAKLQEPSKYQVSCGAPGDYPGSEGWRPYTPGPNDRVLKGPGERCFQRLRPKSETNGTTE